MHALLGAFDFHNQAEEPRKKTKAGKYQRCAKRQKDFVNFTTFSKNWIAPNLAESEWKALTATKFFWNSRENRTNKTGRLEQADNFENEIELVAPDTQDQESVN